MNTGLILMFVALAVCLLIGVPVAFSIGISCMTLLYVNGGPSMDILLQRMVSGAKSFNMLAMPMFIFAGALMVYGSTPRLIKLANMLLRKFPGGLGATAMAACGFFGAVSGSGVASAAAIGKIIGPSMLEEGYPKGLTPALSQPAARWPASSRQASSWWSTPSRPASPWAICSSAAWPPAC